MASIAEPKAGSEIRTEEAIIDYVQKWLNNPVAKNMLKLVCGKSRYGGNRLDIAIRKYMGKEVQCDFRDTIASIVVKFMLDHGASAFGYSNRSLKENLSDPLIRRGMVNVLEGIARYGTRRPFTSVAPFLVVWNYTKLCNLRCEHCYESAGPEAMEDELTSEEAKKVIDEFEESGVVAIAFSGGEPLMRKDIFETAGYAKRHGFYTSVATNGTLINHDLAKRMKEAFDYVEISLDGFEAAHDKFRGIPGAWRRTCEGIKNCVAEGIDTCVALTATRYNLHEIPSLVDFAEKELGVKRVIIFNYVPTGRGKEIIDQDLNPEERQELLEYLYKRMMNNNCRLICYSTAPQYSSVSWKYAFGSESAPLVATHFTNRGAIEALQGKTKSLAEFLGGCGAGRLYCGLEPNGDITPCVFMPIKLGNIRKDRLREIWHSSEILWKLRDRDALEGCGRCEHKYICGGCRARAYGYYNDVQAPDPGCVHNLHYWELLRQEKKSTASDQLSV
ncbi:MAG: radical SAM protein [Candidatus Hadarchaeaceae archaeon]